MVNELLLDLVFYPREVELLKKGSETAFEIMLFLKLYSKWKGIFKGGYSISSFVPSPSTYFFNEGKIKWGFIVSWGNLYYCSMKVSFSISQESLDSYTSFNYSVYSYYCIIYY